LHDSENFNKILNVEPKSFIDKVTGERNIGYIAEELDEIGLDNLVIEKNGEPDAIKYQLVSLYLLEIVKNQNSEIKDLQQRIEAIEISK